MVKQESSYIFAGAFIVKAMMRIFTVVSSAYHYN
jgi:hypothetical protein